MGTFLILLCIVGGGIYYGMSYNAKVGNGTTCPICRNLGAELYRTGKINGRKVVRFKCKKCGSFFDR